MRRSTLRRLRRKADYKTLQRKRPVLRWRSQTWGNRALTRGSAGKGPQKIRPRHAYRLVFRDPETQDIVRTIEGLRFTARRPWDVKAERRRRNKAARASRKAHR